MPDSARFEPWGLRLRLHSFRRCAAIFHLLPRTNGSHRKFKVRAARELLHCNRRTGWQRVGFEIFAIDFVEAVVIRHIVDVRGHRDNVG